MLKRPPALSGCPIRRTLSIVLVAALITAACSSGNAGDEGRSVDPVVTSRTTTTTTTSTTSTTTTASSAISEPLAVPTLDDQIDWLLEKLNGGALTEAEVAERFDAEFLTRNSPGAVMARIAQLQASSTSWALSGREGDQIGAQVNLSTDSGPWIMLIAIGTDGSIEFASVEPDVIGDVEPPASFDELVEALAGAGDVTLLVADVSDGWCDAVYAVEASSPRPIGSDFKLYVLGALVEAIADGDVRWDDTLSIRRDLKSLPSGTFQDLDVGTELTVREFADAMIAISDNTATDHLIDLLGRRRVEAAQAAYGHADPSLNVPFLTTHDMFVLKLVLTDDERDRYVAAGSDERRIVLDTDIATRVVTLADAETFVTPVAIDQLEWFASPDDLCRVMVKLHTHPTASSRVAIREILGANPNAPVGDDWSYVGFKGGSEPGVISLAWYLEGNNGTYVYIVNVTNPDKNLSTIQLVDIAGAGIELIDTS